MSFFTPLRGYNGMRAAVRGAVASAASLFLLATALGVSGAQKLTSAVADEKMSVARVNMTGLVADAGGAPLPKATVYVYTAAPRVGTSPFCPSCYADCGKHQGTDAKGGFLIPSVDSALIFRLLVVEEGYEPLLVSKVDPLHSPIKIVLKKEDARSHDPKWQVRGRVVDSEGHPVAGATVEPIGLKKGASVMFGAIPGVAPLNVTNERGEFRFDCPEATGALTALIKARGLAPRVTSDLHPGLPTPQTVPMASGTTVNGVVRNPSGRKLAGVMVQLVPVDRNTETFTGWAEIGTDPEGRFSLPNVPANRKYLVCVRMDTLAASGMGIGRQTISVGKDGSATDGVVLTVQPASTLTGRVLLTDGKPIRPGTRIMLGRADTWDEQQAVLAADGSFTFQGVPREEKMELIVQVPAYHLATDIPGYDQDQILLKIPASTAKTELQIRLIPDTK